MGSDMDKIALITGASRGFGAAMAEALAGKAHVIALARTVGGLEELDDRIKAAGGTATLVPLDLADGDGVKRMCAALYERWGGIDLWVHTAIHAAPLSPASHIDAKDWAKSVAVNLDVTRALICDIDPLLAPRKGTAVHLDDPRAGAKFFGAYGATKAAQAALFESWAAELESSGRKVLRFEPRPMPTAVRARFFPGEDRAKLSTPAQEAMRLMEILDL